MRGDTYLRSVFTLVVTVLVGAIVAVGLFGVPERGASGRLSSGSTPAPASEPRTERSGPVATPAPASSSSSPSTGKSPAGRSGAVAAAVAAARVERQKFAWFCTVENASGDDRTLVAIAAGIYDGRVEGDRAPVVVVFRDGDAERARVLVRPDRTYALYRAGAVVAEGMLDGGRR